MAVTAKVNGKDVTFDVVLDCGNRPSFVATHVDGVQCPAGHLIKITEKGRYEREKYVDSDFGFKLNDFDQIKQAKGEV